MHPYYYLQQSTLCIKGKKKGKEKGIESLTRPTPKANKVFFFFFWTQNKVGLVQGGPNNYTSSFYIQLVHVLYCITF